jgi:GNAT superfamily N-acetyltransferase
MDASPQTSQVRIADLSGPDAAAVSHLVGAYLFRTEREKETHLGEPSALESLPERYQDEVAHPASAYDGATVLLAERDGASVGVAVVHETGAANELKRLWVDPGARGHRVGSALIDAALELDDRPVRLTVWDWRVDAITLYRRRGFVEVSSWEERDRLLCFEYRPVS